MLQQYIRNRFTAERDLLEDSKIRQAIDSAWEELNQMNYYHALREVKLNPEAKDSQVEVPTPQSDSSIKEIEWRADPSPVDPKMVYIQWSKRHSSHGVAEVVEALGRFGPLQMVRCGDTVDEVVFQTQADAQRATMAQPGPSTNQN